MWNQVYNPFNNTVLSTIAAAIPVVTLLVLIASGKVKAHIAAIIALIVANLIAIFVFTMPAGMSIRASLLGVVSGFFPIGWIVLNVIFLYQITVATGKFELLKRAVGGVTEDRRLQLLLIAFSFGAFFEGASGFGTPVAVTGAVLIGLGFSPLAASGLSLIANTAPVAFGALGTPIQGLASVMASSPDQVGPLAYQLGANHRKQSVDWDNLPFATRKSATFHIPVPVFALRVREMKIETVRKIGSHTFFVARVIHDEGFADSVGLCIVHGFYQAWRLKGRRAELEASLAQDLLNKRGMPHDPLPL